MVRTSSHNDRIQGGFLAIPVPTLLNAWRECRSRNLKRADFTTWLATHEMLARRCTGDPKLIPDYNFTELARLLGGLSQRRLRASIQRLTNAGILLFSPQAIEFPKTNQTDQAIEAIGGGRGAILVPRRLLRYLVAQGSPVLIATAMAVLLRCLSRRRTGFQGRGRLKASWIAELFAIDLRSVKAARAELLRLRWIEPQPSDQHAENRWGRAYRIDLAWERPQGAILPLPADDLTRDFATPCINLDPLREEIQHQELAPPTRTGFRIEEKWKPEEEPSNPIASPPVPRPTMISPAAPPSVPVVMATALPSPRLDDIRDEDLRETGRLLDLHSQAVTRRLVGPSEADRLKFVALAEHARVIGQSNPPGLFAALLRRGSWSFITQAEEDSARRKLKAHFWGRSPASMALGAPKPKVVPMISEDARLVREIKRSVLAAGLSRGRFSAVASCRSELDSSEMGRRVEGIRSSH